MKKKLTMLLGLISSISFAHAEIIQLDNKDAQNCQKQLAAAQDNFPVVLEYADWCKDCKAFEPKFNELVEKTPNRTFFTFNVGNRESEDLAVQSKCLGLSGGPTIPNLIITYKIPVTYMPVNPVRSDATSSLQTMSIEDLQNYINVKLSNGVPTGNPKLF